MSTQDITTTTIEVAARDLRVGDVLVARKAPNLHYSVFEARMAHGTVLVRAECALGQVAYHLPPARLVQVLDRCECDGACVNGVHHGAGVIENGVFKGHTGTCFRCGGKGWRTRADRLRNYWYDNRVRRF